MGVILIGQVANVFSESVTAMFKPNKLGYTFMADTFSTTGFAAIKWGLRMLTMPEFPLDIDKGAFQQSLATPTLAAELVHPVLVKKNNVLFRFV